MRIVVIQGSPSGCRGTSAQYIEYLRRQFPEHRFEDLEVARQIHKLERNERSFDSVTKTMAAADAIIWCYPVYLMLVSAQLKRFIELLFERLDEGALAGKITTAISTSAHFYDHTAHDYVAGVCSDLGMFFVQGFCAESADLLTETGRHQLLGFFRDFCWQVTEQRPLGASIPPVRWSAPTYDPSPTPAVPRAGDAKVLVISDAGPADHNLSRMIDSFERSVAQPVDRLDLAQLRMDGGCLGCMRCTDDGLCTYQDDYAAAFDRLVRPADVVIYAGAVRDRYLSARFKTFLDRYFSNGHRPLGKPQAMGFIISGPLQQLPTLRQVLQAHAQLFRSRRLGIVTDEEPSPARTTEQLEGLAQAVNRWAADPWFDPPTFLGVGGAKVFRDLVYDNRGMLSADHRYYRDHGLYDWPPTQRTGKWWLMTVVLLLKRIPFLRRRAERFLLKGKMRGFHQVLQSQDR